MKREEIQEIMDCLPKGRTKFYYFRDRYALMLLSYIIKGGKFVGEIKHGPYGRLIQKPIVQEVIKKTGNGLLTPKALDSVWPDTYHCYLLTLGMWGGHFSGSRFYNQTSRPGWNLVLQLNFAGRHNQAYHRLLKPGEKQPFHCRDHPVAVGGRHTLAWARIDLDWDMDEALIEEVQTDWIRRAIWSQKYLTAYERSADSNRHRHYLPEYVRNLGCDAKGISQYLEEILKPHRRIWDEAMLASAIWFLKEEIGIGKIFYHTHNFGYKLKGITGSKPPRSLYTQLPKRFCFTKTGQTPGFLLKKNRRKISNLIKTNNPQFYMVDFSDA